MTILYVASTALLVSVGIHKGFKWLREKEIRECTAAIQGFPPPGSSERVQGDSDRQANIRMQSKDYCRTLRVLQVVATLIAIWIIQGVGTLISIALK